MSMTAEVALDRKQFIGGSDAAAILGISPYRTPYQLWLEKTSQQEDEPDPARERIFRRGKLMEPVIVQLAKEEYGLEIAAKNQRFFDPEFPFMSCEIDFEWHDLSGIQNADCKSASPFTAHLWGKEQGDDQIPDYYTTQFLWGQMITGRQRTLCVTLIGSDDLRVYRVERDDEMIGFMREKAVEFWSMVENRIAPPITNLEDIRLAWPKDKGERIEATPEIIEKVERHKLLGKVIAGHEAERELLEVDIFKFMTDRSELVGPDGKKIATRKLQERKGYTVEPTTYRVFRA